MASRIFIAFLAVSAGLGLGAVSDTNSSLYIDDDIFMDMNKITTKKSEVPTDKFAKTETANVYNSLQNSLDDQTREGKTESTEESIETDTEKSVTENKLIPPINGVYLGAFANFGPNEDNVTIATVGDFENMIGKKIAWAYFSDNWFDGISFPDKQVETLKSLQITPYIRIMPRIDFDRRGKNSPYTLENITNGNFDDEIKEWAKAAKKSEVPLMVEFGTEVNGDWFPWNGKWNVANGDLNSGPKTFIKSYRHIVDLFRTEGAYNVTWVYHANAISSPDEDWNKIMSYYPGDEYIDWIGISVYGAQNKLDSWVSFDEVYAPAYQEVTAVTNKPIAIVEFGVSESDFPKAKSEWIEGMFKSLQNNRYPNTKGVSYWHSRFVDDDGVDHNLRLDSSIKSLSTFSNLIADDYFISKTKFSY